MQSIILHSVFTCSLRINVYMVLYKLFYLDLIVLYFQTRRGINYGVLYPPMHVHFIRSRLFLCDIFCDRMYSFILIYAISIYCPEMTHSKVEQYQCNYCKFNFSHNSDLVMHLSTHNGDNMYQCPECDIDFTQNSYLESHIRTHTRKDLYKCCHCEKSFRLKSHLQNHTRRHIGEKLYQCSYCDKAFIG